MLPVGAATSGSGVHGPAISLMNNDASRVKTRNERKPVLLGVGIAQQGLEGVRASAEKLALDRRGQARRRRQVRDRRIDRRVERPQAVATAVLNAGTLVAGLVVPDGSKIDDVLRIGLLKCPEVLGHLLCILSRGPRPCTGEARHKTAEEATEPERARHRPLFEHLANSAEKHAVPSTSQLPPFQTPERPPPRTGRPQEQPPYNPC